MAELLIRASSQDGALLRRIYGMDGGSAAPARPDRIVVDAHTPVMKTDILSTARRAGTPLLIDPQTYYLHGLSTPTIRGPACRLVIHLSGRPQRHPVRTLSKTSSPVSSTTRSRMVQRRSSLPTSTSTDLAVTGRRCRRLCGVVLVTFSIATGSRCRLPLCWPSGGGRSTRSRARLPSTLRCAL